MMAPFVTEEQVEFCEFPPPPFVAFLSDRDEWEDFTSIATSRDWQASLRHIEAWEGPRCQRGTAPKHPVSLSPCLAECAATNLARWEQNVQDRQRQELSHIGISVEIEYH